MFAKYYKNCFQNRSSSNMKTIILEHETHNTELKNYGLETLREEHTWETRLQMGKKY
jgi:hypothetical protein